MVFPSVVSEEYMGCKKAHKHLLGLSMPLRRNDIVFTCCLVWPHSVSS